MCNFLRFLGTLSILPLVVEIFWSWNGLFVREIKHWSWSDYIQGIRKHLFMMSLLLLLCLSLLAVHVNRYSWSSRVCFLAEHRDVTALVCLMLFWLGVDLVRFLLQSTKKLQWKSFRNFQWVSVLMHPTVSDWILNPIVKWNCICWLCFLHWSCCFCRWLLCVDFRTCCCCQRISQNNIFWISSPLEWWSLTDSAQNGCRSASALFCAGHRSWFLTSELFWFSVTSLQQFNSFLWTFVLHSKCCH